MSEDPTRAMVRPADPGLPSYGSLGPADPRADPATEPALRPVQPAAVGGPVPGGPTAATPTGQARPDPGPRATAVTRTRTGGLWTGLILSAVVLVFLLVFILQNLRPVQISFLGAVGTLPVGVALLFAAVAGLLLVAIPGGVRILQLRLVARRGARRSG